MWSQVAVDAFPVQLVRISNSYAGLWIYLLAIPSNFELPKDYCSHRGDNRDQHNMLHVMCGIATYPTSSARGPSHELVPCQTVTSKGMYFGDVCHVERTVEGNLQGKWSRFTCTRASCWAVWFASSFRICPCQAPDWQIFPTWDVLVAMEPEDHNNRKIKTLNPWR